MQFLKLCIFSVFLAICFCLSVTHPLSAAQQMQKNSSLERPLSEKADRLAALIRASDEQKAELEQVCQFIEENWDSWVNDPSILEQYSYLRFQMTEKTFITVHPNVPEVCVYLNGHTKILGNGAFKRVVKAFCYILEGEVAVALPFQIDGKDFLKFPDDINLLQWLSSNKSSPEYTPSTAEESKNYSDLLSYLSTNRSILNSSDWYSSNSSTESGLASHSETDSTDDSQVDWIGIMNDILMHEPFMLEQAQGCAGVIQAYFISYHMTADLKKIPFFVTKYYNGGTLDHLVQKNMNANKPVELEEKLLVCHDILLGLKELHGRKISHGDFHAGNILIEKDLSSDRVKGVFIADFGLSKFADDSHAFKSDLARGYFMLKDYLLESTEEDVVLAFLNDAYFAESSAEEMYRQFLGLLPVLVDHEAERRITANAMKKLGPKVRYQNIVRWSL